VSVKVKGRYCPNCGKQVLAQRNGHGVRNTAAIGGSLATLGASLLLGKREIWRCPNCGGRTQPRMGALGQPTGRQPGQYRCQKNDHLLNAKHHACPIDGSPVRRI
jgi:ribosomal protein S27AE